MVCLSWVGNGPVRRYRFSGLEWSWKNGENHRRLELNSQKMLELAMRPEEWGMRRMKLSESVAKINENSLLNIFGGSICAGSI